MSTNDELKNKTDNGTKPVLAVTLLLALWLMWFASIVLLSVLCDGKYFWWRMVVIYPLTMVAFKVSVIVWKHYA